MVIERSWQWKIHRAFAHFNELGQRIEEYQAGKHYRAVCPEPPRSDSIQWRFVLEITQPPPPQIAIVLGDFLFNVRSALDHIAVARAPPSRKRSAGFPIVMDPNDAEQMRK